MGCVKLESVDFFWFDFDFLEAAETWISSIFDLGPWPTLIILGC